MKEFIALPRGVAIVAARSDAIGLVRATQNDNNAGSTTMTDREPVETDTLSYSEVGGSPTAGYTEYMRMRYDDFLISNVSQSKGELAGLDGIGTDGSGLSEGANSTDPPIWDWVMKVEDSGLSSFSPGSFDSLF